MSKTVKQRWETSQNASLCKLHPLEENERLVLPKRFRLRRALAIACWFLPDVLKWEIILQLQENIYSLDFSNKGLTLSSELLILISSKEKCLSYCEKILSSRELFGTILQEDLKNALSELRIIRKSTKVTYPIRRKGYKDKGTWKPPHRRIDNFDFSLTEKQNMKELKESLVRLIANLYLVKL